MTTLITRDGKVIVLNDDGTWRPGSSPGSMLKRFAALKIPPAVAETVRGLFSRVGIRVLDTGEEFTCVQRADRLEFVPDINAKTVDCIVSVHAFQLERLAGQVETGTLDEVERFRIARALFGSATGRRTILQTPLMSNAVLRRMIRGKNLMHVTMVSPDPTQEPDAQYTVIFINGEHLAVPGLHGTPGRVLRVPLAEVVELQRLMYAGLKSAGAPSTWLKIAKAYVDWRKRVEVS